MSKRILEIPNEEIYPTSWDDFPRITFSLWKPMIELGFSQFTWAIGGLITPAPRTMAEAMHLAIQLTDRYAKLSDKVQFGIPQCLSPVTVIDDDLKTCEDGIAFVGLLNARS